MLLGLDGEARVPLGRFGLLGFAPIDDAAYDGERAALAACERWIGDDAVLPRPDTDSGPERGRISHDTKE